MPRHDHETSTTDRKPDASVRNPDAFTVIDLPDDGREVPVAIRHPDGGVLILTVALRAHRGTLTAILPGWSVVVREVADTGQVTVS